MQGQATGHAAGGAAAVGQGQATENAAGGAPVGQAHAPVTIVIPEGTRVTEATRHAFRAALEAAASDPSTLRVCRLAQLFAYAISDRQLYGMFPEIKEFVKLAKAMLKTGTLVRGGGGPTDLYNLICKSQYLRIEKIAKLKLLQEYGLRGDLTTSFLDAWYLMQPKDQAGSTR